MKKNNLFITGSSGFLGTNFLKVVKDQNYNISSYDVIENTIVNENLNHVIGNILIMNYWLNLCRDQILSIILQV